MKTYFSLKSILNNDPPEDKNKALSPRDMLLADIAKTQHALEVASGDTNRTSTGRTSVINHAPRE